MRKAMIGVSLWVAATACNSSSLQPHPPENVASSTPVPTDPPDVTVNMPVAALEALAIGPSLESAVSGGGAFPLVTTNELYLIARWHKLAGLHLMRVEVRDPDGDLYTRSLVAMSDASAGPDELHLAGLPHPLRIRRATRAGHLEGVFRLGVAGTQIARQGRAGAWTFRVYMDEAQTASGSIQAVLQ